ncbi:MAG: ABC transporter permease [Deltaproteobacteria bacterium]|nr:ABC transporter permease [Deltaproteobacteria bacterium]
MSRRTLWSRLARRTTVRVGALVLALVVGAAVAGPWVAPEAADACLLERELETPSLSHWLGTDADGCDIAGLLAHGAGLSLQVGLVVVTVSAVLGTLLGLLAGMRGGWVDRLLMFVLECFQAFPGFLVALSILAVAPRPSVGLVIAALCVSGWVGYARLVRGQALLLRESDYVLAARALGHSEGHIAIREVLPNLVSPVIVQATFGLAGAILAEAGLSFLGLGVPPGTPSWGAMLHQGRSYLLVAPWLSIVPGVAIAATVMAFNFLGDALRDALDPTLRGSGN